MNTLQLGKSGSFKKAVLPHVLREASGKPPVEMCCGSFAVLGFCGVLASKQTHLDELKGKSLFFSYSGDCRLI